MNINKVFSFAWRILISIVLGLISYFLIFQIRDALRLFEPYFLSDLFLLISWSIFFGILWVMLKSELKQNDVQIAESTVMNQNTANLAMRTLMMLSVCCLIMVIAPWPGLYNYAFMIVYLNAGVISGAYIVAPIVLMLVSVVFSYKKRNLQLTPRQIKIMYVLSVSVFVTLLSEIYILYKAIIFDFGV